MLNFVILPVILVKNSDLYVRVERRAPDLPEHAHGFASVTLSLVPAFAATQAEERIVLSSFFDRSIVVLAVNGRLTQ